MTLQCKNFKYLYTDMSCSSYETQCLGFNRMFTLGTEYVWFLKDVSFRAFDYQRFTVGASVPKQPEQEIVLECGRSTAPHCVCLGQSSEVEPRKTQNTEGAPERISRNEKAPCLLML